MAPAARPDPEFVDALESAARWARRDGSPVVTTGQVLLNVPARGRIEGLPSLSGELREAVGRGDPGDDVDLSVSTQFEPAVDDDVWFEVEAVLRGAAYSARSRRGSEPPAFSPALRRAVYEAIHDATRSGSDQVGVARLVSAMVSLTGSAAEQLLRGRPAEANAEMLDRLQVPQTCDDRSGCSVPVFLFQLFGAVAVRGPWRLPVWGVGRALQVPMYWSYWRHGAGCGHILPWLVWGKAITAAAALGRNRVGGAEVLLAILSLDEDFAWCGVSLTPRVARYNQAGEILRSHGIALPDAVRAAARLESLASDAEDDLTGVPVKGWPAQREKPGGPNVGRTALLALRSASHAARAAGHPFAGTSHILATLLSDVDQPAGRLLRVLGVDPDAVRSEVDGRLAVGSAPRTQ